MKQAHIEDADLAERISSVECCTPGTRADFQKQLEDKENVAGIPAAAAHRNFVLNTKAELRPRMTLGATIYGLGGVHRYFVRANGIVAFSAAQSNEKGIALARAAGFDIFN